MSKKSILKKLYFLTHLNFCAKIMTYSSIFQHEISRQKLIFWIWFWREDSNIWRSSILTKKHLNFRAKISSWILAWKFKYLKIIFWRENSNKKKSTLLKVEFSDKNWMFGTVCASKRCKKWPETKDTQKMPQVRCSLQFYLLRHLPENWQQWIY